MAQDLIEALSSRAPLRLKAMLDAHKDARVAECHDGIAMFKELIALRNTTGLVEESIDHDIAVEEMRDTQLADGCAVSEFTAKVNSLVKDHAPYMTNGFKDQTAMNKFIVKAWRTHSGWAAATVATVSARAALSSRASFHTRQ